MEQDVEIYIKSCPQCLWFKRLPERANLNPIEVTRPMELVHIDYLTIEAQKNSKSLEDVNILIVTDHFTRYAHTPTAKHPVLACVSSLGKFWPSGSQTPGAPPGTQKVPLYQ